MLRLMLSDCQDPLEADLVGDDIQLIGFSIDTRTIEAGDMYIAISGDRYDGHDFCHQAAEKGATSLLVEREMDVDLPQLVVEDSRKALGLLAQLWARGYQLPTVAVTGSSGKTTVKEMIASILSQLGPVLSTRGNLNNDIGVPLTLLRMRSHHQYAVIEMGANAPGEILGLSKLVGPDVALVNNVGAAHLEGFGSESDVARAKSEIYAGLSADGWAVINADDHYADVMREAASHCHRQEFGTEDDAPVQLLAGDSLNIACGGKKLSPRFSLLGQHNRMNAIAATAAAQCMDVQAVAVMSGLANVQAVPGRLQTRQGINGATIIDDTYNANPNSAQAAIDVLAELPGTRILVLGDMGELGESAEQMHAQIGDYAKQAGIDQLLTVGTLSVHASAKFDSAMHFDSQALVVDYLGSRLNDNTALLVKGSRGSKMERIVEPLLSPQHESDAQLEVDAFDSTEAISL